jgi:precorrin-2 dehydrogenase/sirohydrochlorin ferrochelatase
MSGYPIFLNLKGRKCLVFGGGEVAQRKIKALLKRGAKVTCVSKDFSKSLRRWANSRTLLLHRLSSNQWRTPRNDEWNGAHLVISATSDRNFNARVARECRKRKIWVNAVDDPPHCDFYSAAIVERGPLQIAISTDGTSPLFAKRLREELEKVIPASTGRLLERIGKIRRQILDRKKDK